MNPQTFAVQFENLPTEWVGEGRIQLVWQSQIRPVQYTPSAENVWHLSVPIKEGKWTGKSVGRNSDGRRFIYFAWLNASGKMFRRIKLYQQQVTGESIVLRGVMKDSSPACSTAIVVQ